MALLEEEHPEGELSEFKAFCHFQFSFCFMLMVEGMSSQLSTLGPMPSLPAMLPTMLNSSPSGITTQNNFFLKSLFGHEILSKQQKSS